jgi:hypothetical protein
MANEYVTSTGLAIPSTQDLLDKLSTEQRAEISVHLDTDADSPIGQLNGIFASHLREAWEVLQISFHGMDPAQAEDALLDALAALTGTRRSKATPSKFVGTRKLDVNLNAGTTLPIGSVASVAGFPLIRFVTTEVVVSVAAGSYKVSAECEQKGPVVCNANTLTVIATPVVGWNTVNNAFDAELGQEVDKDPGLRLRREQELRATGAANPESLRADLLAYEDAGTKPILDCHVFFNDEDTLSPEGLPGHSMEALVFDGLSSSVPNDTIAQIIWDGKPGGIKMIGSVSGLAEDSEGIKHVMSFSRPVIQDIAFQFTIQIDPDTYVGDTAVKDAIVKRFFEKVHQGSVIRCNDYIGTLIALSGVIDVPGGIQIAFNGSAFPPAGTNLPLGLREMGNTQSSWITLTTV